MDHGHYVPEVHNSTGERWLFCVDFYTHGTNENGVDDRSKYLAHNCQNYQNHKSLQLGIVVKRVVLVFVVLFCFVVVVHLLFSKVVTHLFTVLL